MHSSRNFDKNLEVSDFWRIFAASLSKRMMHRKPILLIAAGLLAAGLLAAQSSGVSGYSGFSGFSGASGGFELRKEHDSLYWLNSWRLPYPVYQFQTGDVDGNGTVDALVGVIKSTRFYPERGRRLFIFKQVRGKARALWLGSKLGGTLEDFRFIAPTGGDSIGRVRALESAGDSLYVVSDYRWGGFGLTFDRYIIKCADKETAIKTFSQ